MPSRFLTYLFSFSGTGNQRLLRPIGIAITGNKVFVTDALLNTVLEFDTTGKFIKIFNQNQIARILYVSVNPINGNLYVTDRGKKQVDIFSQEGAYLGFFDPKLPKKQLPKFFSAGKQWDPTIVAFAPDGTMYALEVLNGHRLLKFDTTRQVREVGRQRRLREAMPPKARRCSSSRTARRPQRPGLRRRQQQPPHAGVRPNRSTSSRSSSRGVCRAASTSSMKRAVPGRQGQVRHGRTRSRTTPRSGTATASKLLNFGKQGVLDGQFQYPNSSCRVERKQDVHRRHAQRPHPGVGMALAGRAHTIAGDIRRTGAGA